MPDLAFIHPLLASNPLPTDTLHGAVRQVATAGALLDTRLGAVFPRDRASASLAAAWPATLRPALYGGIDDVAAFAERLRSALPPLREAAPFAATEAHARKTVSDGLHVLKLAAVAHAAAAGETAAALSRFCRAGDAAGAHPPDGATGIEAVALAAVISAQLAMERAWRGVAAGFDALLAQLAGGAVNSALLAARLDGAHAGWNELAAHLRAPSSAPRALAGGIPREAGAAPGLRTVSAFRHGGIWHGADAVAAVVDLLDSLATGIAQLPSPGRASAPLVGRHVDAVRALAEAWPARLRPRLLATMAQLQQFGEQFVELDGPALQAAFGRIRPGDADGPQHAAMLVAAVEARLAALGHSFDAAALDVGEYLSAMARAALELDSDTGAVALQLASGQARAEALACLAARLRVRIDAAPPRRWLPAPLAALVGGPARSPGARLESVARELDALRSAQAGAMKDAASLQSLLPALASYLTAIDRLGAGLAAALAGVDTLHGQLGELRVALVAGPGSGAIAGAQLRTALADWRAIARRVGRLPRSRHAGGSVCLAHKAFMHNR